VPELALLDKATTVVIVFTFHPAPIKAEVEAALALQGAMQLLQRAATVALALVRQSVVRQLLVVVEVAALGESHYLLVRAVPGAAATPEVSHKTEPQTLAAAAAQATY
jgi:hypothetical protein